MATSRRRERELARRRFERRRQAEQERRAKAKKRNTYVGAILGTAAVIAAIAVVGVVIDHHHHHAKKKTGVSAAATPSASATASPSATPAPAAPTKCAAISPNPPAKGEPKIPPVTGKPSTKLVTHDIKIGKGAAAKKGDNVTVKYVGVSCSTGKVFDASYTDGAPKQEFTVKPLGGGTVIPGWDQGLVGMKAGGVRELVVPAALGYGTAGSPPSIKGNETLIFVISMVSV